MALSLSNPPHTNILFSLVHPALHIIHAQYTYFQSHHHKGFTLIAAMSLVGGGRGLLGSGLVAAGGSPGTNL